MNQFSSKQSSSLNGVIEIPGDKSISQRVLILGSIAIGTTRIKGISYSDDVNNLIKNLKLLGVKVIKKKNFNYYIRSRDRGIKFNKKKPLHGKFWYSYKINVGTFV